MYRFWLAGRPISTPIPPPLPKCPQVKLMNAPTGTCCALKLMLPWNGGTTLLMCVSHRSLLHRPAGQPADELALQREEQNRRRDDRHERPGEKHTILLRVRPDVLVQDNRQRQFRLRLEVDVWREERIPHPEETDQAKRPGHRPNERHRQ